MVRGADGTADGPIKKSAVNDTTRNTAHKAANAVGQRRFLHVRTISIVVATTALVAGCANLNTVSRHTDYSGKNQEARAVHLDAQQRLILFAPQHYCAEPSPDALAAYASALGAGASGLPEKEIAATIDTGSVAALIGSRGQSITLMRDVSYRRCEAAAGGASTNGRAPRS